MATAEPPSFCDFKEIPSDLLHETIRNKKHEICEQLHIDSQTIDIFKIQGYLDESVADGASSSIVLTALLAQEDTSVWHSVLDTLEKDESYQSHVKKIICTHAAYLNSHPEEITKFDKSPKASKQLQNTARLACLLVDGGRRILLNYFTKLLKSRYETLSTAFGTKRFKQMLERQSVSGNPILSREQCLRVRQSQLQEDTVIYTFDSSLIVNLLDAAILQPGARLAALVSEADRATLREKLADIKHALKVVYLELTHEGTNDLRFESFVTSITGALNCCLPDDEGKHKLATAVKMLRTYEFGHERIRVLQQAIRRCQDVNDLDTKAVVLNTSEQVIAAIHDQTDSAAAAMGNLQEGLQSTVTAQSKVTQEHIASSSDKILGAAAVTHQRLQRVETKLTEEPGTNNQNIPAIERIFESHENSFKILIMNRAEKIDQDDVKEDLSSMLGEGNWDFVIDLDHDSRSSGIHDMMSSKLSLHKTFSVVVYNERINLTDAEISRVAEGKAAIWLLGNGCSQQEQNPPKIPPGDSAPGQVGRVVEQLLGKVFEKLKKKKRLFIAAAIMGETSLPLMKKILGRMEDIFDCSQSDISSRSPDIVIASIGTKAGIKNFSSDNIHTTHCSFSSTQARMPFSKFNRAHISEGGYILPTSEGNCLLPNTVYTRLSSIMTVYHKDIGKYTCPDGSDLETELDRMRVQYLKGGDISPTEFYLHEHYGLFYALRSDMETTHKKIAELLKDRAKEPHRGYDKQYFTIKHEPSGGGSTVLEYVLFKLQDQYPCLKLHNLHVEDTATIAQELKGLYERTNETPLLIAIDNPEVQKTQIQTFSNLLANEFVKCLIVSTESVWKNPHAPHLQTEDTSAETDEEEGHATETNQRYQVHVSSTLRNKADKEKFKLLYKKFNKRCQAKNKMFLYGLEAWLGQYDRLEQVVLRSCMQQATQNDLRLLKILCCLNKHTRENNSVSLKLFEFLIDDGQEEPAGEESDTLFDNIGSVKDLLIYNSDTCEIKLVHHCIVDPVYKFLQAGWSAQYSGENSGDAELPGAHPLSMSELLESNLEDLHEVVVNDTSGKQLSGDLCRKLLIERKEKTETKYSPFMKCLKEEAQNLSKTISDYLEMFIEAFVDASQQNHMRGLYARYLLHDLHDIENSKKQMKLALGVPGQSMREASQPLHNQQLLTAYGVLYKSYATKDFDKCLQQRQPLNNALTAMLDDVKESVAAFQLAQEVQLRADSLHSRINPMCYIGEATVRSAYLDTVFKHVCSSNRKQFISYISSVRDPFVKYCERDALQALEKITTLGRLDRIDDPYPETTERKKTTVKFQLLRLRHDGHLSCRNVLKELDPQVAYDIGFLVRARNSRLNVNTRDLQTLPYLKDLSSNELKLIVRHIDARLGNRVTLLSANYNDIITAMILLKQKGEETFDISYALECATKWRTNYPDDLRANFMYSVLNFVAGITTNNNLRIDYYKEALSERTKVLQKNPAAKNKRTRMYQIAKGEGLSCVQPYSPGPHRPDQLQLFEGRLLNKLDVQVEPNLDKELKAICDSKTKEANLPVERRPRVRFNLVMCYDSLLATNLHVVY